MHYGEDRVYIDRGIDYSGLIIHYPSVVISDGRLSTRIFDLYVKLIIDNNVGSISQILGTSLTRTKIQYLSRYAHSHIPSTTDVGFSAFCLGSCELSRMKSESVSGDWDRDEWQLFFEALDNYLTQEGSPYIRLSQIGLGLTSNSMSNDAFSRTRDLNYFFIRKNLLKNPEYLHEHLIVNDCEVDDYSFKIKRKCSPDSEFLDKLLEYGIKTIGSDLLLNDRIIGPYNALTGFGEFKSNVDIDIPYTVNDKFLIFKGETRFLTIVPNSYPNNINISNEDNPELYFTKNAIEAINTQINSKFQSAYENI